MYTITRSGVIMKLVTQLPEINGVSGDQFERRQE